MRLTDRLVLAWLTLSVLCASATAADYPVGCGATAASDLANAVSSAVAGPDASNSVTLTGGCTYTMAWDGSTKAVDLSPIIFKAINTVVIIKGNGASIVRDGASGDARFFHVAAGGNLTLDQLTLSGGIARGDAGVDGSFDGVASHPGAGGMYSGLGGAVLNDGALTVSGATFANNQAIGGNGGRGISLARGGGGGGGMGGAIFSRGSVRIERSTFTANFAIGGEPGGFQTCSVNGSSCPNAGGGGGGTGGSGGAPGQNGVAGGYGGGGGASGWSGSTQAGVGGFGGGAGGSSASQATGGEFAGNSSPNGFGGGGGAGLGGAVCIESVASFAQITQSTFSGNTATGGGGGTPIGSGGAGSAAGGAVFLGSGTLSMLADTLAGNSASGGAVVNAVNAQNGGNGQGGSLYVHAGANLNLALTVVTGGTVAAGASNNGSAGSASGADAFGVLTSRGYNLVSSRAASSGYIVTDLPDGTAAGLGALTNNGGITPTLLPLAGSAAINAGPPNYCNLLTSDQRGAPRPFGAGCDIGAVEVSDLLFRNGFEVGATGLVQCAGAGGYLDGLIDDFTGPALLPAWASNSNGGTVTVNQGVTVSSPSSLNRFPFVAAGNVIPATANFSVRWRATFANANAVAAKGTGSLVLSAGLPTNGGSDNLSLHVADAWQSDRLDVRARTNASTFNSVYIAFTPPNTTHDVEYCWLGGSIEIWVDGARVMRAPSAGITRPDSLWFGNPAVAAPGFDWPSFVLQHVYVRALFP